MSKSLDNYISIVDKSSEMFGKTMSIPDGLIVKYFELCTDESAESISQIKERMDKGENPRNLKMELAEAIVKIYHGEDEAKKAKDDFINLFSKKETPDEMPEFELAGENIVDVLVASKLVGSKSDARRNIEQGGVKINEKVVADVNEKVRSGDVIQKGKRFFIRIA